MKKLISRLLILICFTGSIAYGNAIEEFDKTVNELKGNVIYVDFWASWCEPCRKSFPWMNEIQGKYKDSAFKILSINVDSDKELADKFLQEVKADFLIHYDPKGDLAKKFKLKGMPSSFLINKQGEIVSAHVGFTASKKKKYEQQIINLIDR